MREQADTEVAVVLVYGVEFNDCAGFIVMEPRGRTRADEVTWPSSVLQRINASYLRRCGVEDV